MKKLRIPLILVGAMWLATIADAVLPIDLRQFALVPRTFPGTIGIVAIPFVHNDFAHLASNSVPLLVLLSLVVAFHPKPLPLIFGLILLSGALLWLCGRPYRHIGASVLVYALVLYLITSGIRSKRIVPMLVAIGVGIVYGSTIFLGVLPIGNEGVSWDGHLAGAIAGILFGSCFGLPNPESQTIAVSAN